MNNYPNYHLYIALAAQRDSVIFTVAFFTLIIGFYFLVLQRKSPQLMPAMRLLCVLGFYMILFGGIVWSLGQ